MDDLGFLSRQELELSRDGLSGCPHLFDVPPAGPELELACQDVVLFQQSPSGPVKLTQWRPSPRCVKYACPSMWLPGMVLDRALQVSVSLRNGS